MRLSITIFRKLINYLHTCYLHFQYRSSGQWRTPFIFSFNYQFIRTLITVTQSLFKFNITIWLIHTKCCAFNIVNYLSIFPFIFVTCLYLKLKLQLYWRVIRSTSSDVFLGKGVLKICSKFTWEHPCRGVISIKLRSNFIKITLQHGCSPVYLLHIFRIPFVKNTSGGLLLIYSNLREGYTVKFFFQGIS